MKNAPQQWPLDRRAVINLLGDYHIQPTQQRIDIAQIMFSCAQHLSAEQVLTAVNLSRPSVSKATVYNTLGLFADKGLVRQVIVDPSRVFYDSNTSEHHHIYNIDSGTLTDIEPEQLTVSGVPECPAGMVTEGIDVIIRIRST